MEPTHEAPPIARLALLHPQSRVFLSRQVAAEPAELGMVHRHPDGGLLLSGSVASTLAEEGPFVPACLMDVRARMPALAGLDVLPPGSTGILAPDGAWEVTPENAEGSSPDIATLPWTCQCCGRSQSGVPDMVAASPAERARQAGREEYIVEEGTDLVVMEARGQRDYFHRTVLPIPLDFGAPMTASFGFGVWCTLSAENFERYASTFDDHDQAKLGGLPGYLAHSLPGYPETLHLRVVSQPNNDRM